MPHELILGISLFAGRSFYSFPLPQDIVCKTVYEFWFEEPTGSQTQFFGDGSSVPWEVAKNTEQIVEMLRRMPSHQLLVTLEEMAMQEGERRTLPYVLALHAFCVVDPTLCAPASDPSQFVVTLQIISTPSITDTRNFFNKK
ncbi:unnamed protein product [Prunus armeniaca]|uniref:Uncharacterized protein n=1 Tax=Prunus armeniaca TaxID=36596 RepID=A0A6J5U0V0_PRUAR|nr:unnamed protein product [Prunus armeniaca]